MTTTRAMTARFRVRGWLYAVSALHVGGAGQDPNAALSVALDGRGRPYVPGTSLAGALRSLLHPGPDQASGPRGKTANELWGYAESRSKDGTVSRIVVRDALITAGTGLDEEDLPSAALDPARLETRFSVGIDRRGGVAAHGFLHARTVVPKGSYLRFELDLNATERTLEDDREQLKRLLRLLHDGGLRVGAARTRGLGHLELADEHTEVREEDFGSAAGLLAALGGAATPWDCEEWKKAPPPARQTMSVKITWSPAAPVMVRSAADGFMVDAIPLASAVEPGKVALVLPGTSLKGVLRSRAEQIERTVLRRDAPAAAHDAPATDRSAAFRQQLDQLDAVRALFGAAPLGKPDDPRGIGIVTVDDCYATAPVPATTWEAVYEPAAKDADATPPALVELRKHKLERADHVAIDRWTGGAADKRLYSVLEPHGVTWDPINLTVDLGRLAHHHADIDEAAQALLLLVLRDLKAGRIPVGYATNRGMGDITVHDITLTLPDHPAGVELDDYLTSDTARELTTSWCAYIDGSTA
ncbi:RAMP superfamily CRISPR-associated protein [Streptomyces sp. NPDC003480]